MASGRPVAKPYPATVTLEGGKVVPVDEVHYCLGRNFYRVSWLTKNGARGCIAEWTANGFEELSQEEFLATVRKRNT